MIKIAGKYNPPENYLRDLATEQEATLSFGAEGNHINKQAWASVGWKVAEVNFQKKLARFVKK